MKVTAQTIISLFRQADIEGYISLGAPADEYDSEAQALALALSGLKDEAFTPENIAAIINEIWGRSFNLGQADLAVRQAAIKSITEDIVKLSSAGA